MTGGFSPVFGHAAASEVDECELVLAQRAADDLSALCEEEPVDCGSAGVWWRFTREPLPAEEQPSGAVVFVGANALGLSLTVTRKVVRRVDGAPAPLDRMTLSEQLRSGECEVIATLPAPLSLRLHLNMDLTVWPERAPGEFLT